MREVGDRAGEAITSLNMAMLARGMGQPQRALDLLRQAVLLEGQVQHPDYPQDAALLTKWEAASPNGEPLPSSSSNTSATLGLSSEQVQTIQENTLAVLTEMPEKHGELV